MAPISVRAPATSANLGSGFDCLGLALDLWNEIEARVTGSGDRESDNLILQAARAVCDQVREPYPGFELRSTNRIPFGRGLGSSAAAIACGLLLANRWLGDALDSPALLHLANALEGHPDNVAPCLLGGLRVATTSDDGSVVEVRVPLALQLRTVVFVPEHRVPTSHARGVLPSIVPMPDALFNVARSSLLIAAVASGRADALAEATRDRLHQSYRLSLFPAGATLLENAMEAGALGAYTSGAGPSVLALCGDDRQADCVAAALESTAERKGIAGEVLRLSLTETGAHVVD